MQPGSVRRDAGAAAVEFALVLPLLLIVLLGIADAGRVLQTQLVISAAAQDGARLAALGQPDVTSRTIAAAADAGAVQVTVTGCPGGFAPQADATVTITCLVPLDTPGASASVTLTAKATEPCEG